MNQNESLGKALRLIAPSVILVAASYESLSRYLASSYGLLLAPITTIVLFALLRFLAMVAMWVARWLYRLYHAWNYASQAFKDSVVGTVAFPITVALFVVLVPASWLIVIPFRAFRLVVWLDNVNLLSLTSCFCPSCRCGLVLWP